MNFKYSVSGFVTYIGATIDKYLLNTAIEHGDADLVTRMINKGVNFELEDDQGKRAIHRACEIGNVAIVRILINYHCKLESRTKSGQTALHIICNNGYVNVLRLLLAQNCELEPRDNASNRPLDLANQSGNTSCALLLSQAIEARDKARRASMAPTTSRKESVTKNCQSTIKKWFHWPRSKRARPTKSDDPDNDRTICPVCMEHERDCSFDCGHTFCSSCGHKVSVCPMCRATPTNPRRIII